MSRVESFAARVQHQQQTFGERLEVAEFLSELDVGVLDVERSVENRDAGTGIGDNLLARRQELAQSAAGARGAGERDARKVVRHVGSLELAVELCRVTLPNPFEQEY